GGIMRSHLGGVAQLFRCCSSAERGAQPVRLLFQRRFERGERFLGHAAFEQHRAVEFARRRRHARSHGMLLGLVLGIGGGCASSYLPSAYKPQGAAPCHWMSTCSAQYASLAARSFSRSSASLAMSALAASGWPDRAAPRARAKCVMLSTWASGVGLTASCAAAFQSPRSIA